MNHDFLAERFEADRARLQAVAYRLLGSSSEADDAVQEAWLRLSRTDSDAVDNLSGWLTTVVARICLDMLRSRQSRREEPLLPESEVLPGADNPEHEAVLADSVGLAMQAVLQRLAPAERVAFVLHDVFGVPFDDIAGIVGRTPAAARQLASRGRRRVQGVSGDGYAADMGRQREVVEAFFRASRSGDFQALLAVLDPDVVLRPDSAALQMGARNGWITSELRGAEAVARQFSGQAQGALLATIDGTPGAVWAPGGTPRVAIVFTVTGEKVTELRLEANPEALQRRTIVIKDAP